jgi:hypothetical protein
LGSPDSHLGPLTRRQLLAGGAIALGAAAAGVELAGRPWPHGRQAATALPRCVSLGANGVINPGSSQDYRSCRAFVLGTRTSWVRIWADWPSLQPERGLRPDRGTGAWRLRELDRQIEQANADGVKVILTAYRFPAWATGASGADQHPLFKLPADVGPGSPWARWIGFLIRRYGREIAGLELVNEPNGQVWPLADAPRTVARMFVTARALQLNGAPLLIGPATSDAPEAAPAAFTGTLLDELDRLGFEPGGAFAWAHHNYTDVEHDRAGGTQEILGLLDGRWRGRSGLLITEGGARLSKIAELYPEADPRAKQAELIRRNRERLSTTPGVGMLGQYLFYTDPAFDCGLCDADGAKRPAYEAWAQFDKL